MEEFVVTLVVLAVLALLTVPIILLVLVVGLKRLVREVRDGQDLTLETVNLLRRRLDELGAPAAGGPAPAPATPASAPAVAASIEVPAPAATVPAALQPAPAAQAPLAAEAFAEALSAPATPPPLPPPVPPPFSPAEAPELAPEPAPRSRLAQTVAEILSAGWNWLLVNESYRPTGVTAEYAIATTWLTRLGIVALVIGVGFGLKWSIDHGWLSKEIRVAMAMVFGVAMLGAGVRLSGRGRKYNVLGQGFMGGGVVVLYFSAYAASPLWHILPMSVAYGLMVLITLAAGVLAVRLNSMLVAILGIAGGYMTPVMLSTGSGNLLGLYSYMVILSLGVLGVAQAKQWRLMNYLALVFTYALIVVSLDKYYAAGRFTLCFPFISALFVIHSTVVIFQSLVKGRKATVLELIHLCANSMAYAVIGYWLIRDAYGRPYPAALFIGLALFYMVHVGAFLKRRLIDRPLLTALIALAGLYATATLPLVFEKESLTMSFALVSLTFLWLGQRMNSGFLQGLAQGLYLFVFLRLVVFDVGENYGSHPSAAAPMAAYWKAMLERLWTFGVCIGSVAAAFFLQRRAPPPSPALVVRAENDARLLAGAGVARQALYWFAVLFGFLVVFLELNAMFVYWEPLRLPVLTSLCCAMAAYFLWGALSAPAPSGVLLTAGSVFVVGAVLKLFVWDLQAWHFGEPAIYDTEYTLFQAGMRLLDFGVLIGLLGAAWALFRRTPDRRALVRIYGYGCLALLFIYLTLELRSLLYWKLRDFLGGGISVLWAVLAISYIAGGVWKNVRPLRFIGLLLFAVVLGKVFLSDLSGMLVIYRVIAFLVVGTALLLGSFAYMYANRKFAKGE